MHLNKAIVVGVVTSAGPKLRYDERSHPTCTFWLAVEEANKDGQAHHTYIPVEIIGKYAESAAESLERGTECLVEGRLQYRKSIGKDGKEKAGLVLTSWYVTIGSPALAGVPVAARSDDGATREPEAAPKPGKPRYPKWKPEPSQQN